MILVMPASSQLSLGGIQRLEALGPCFRRGDDEADAFAGATMKLTLSQG